MWRSSPKTVKKCEKFGQNSIYALKQSINVPEPIFTKVTRDRLLVKSSDIEFHENWTNRLVGDARSQLNERGEDAVSTYGVYIL
jgi:hypothetical protein